jgi:intein/homing endonuclease/phage terminase large subunit-like protein
MPSNINVNKNKFKAKLCRASFAEFVKEFWDQVPGAAPLVWNWHMDVLCNELQDVAERVFRGERKKHDVIFNVSPGTSKSSISSILFHPWTWTRMPEARHLCASHTAELVLDLAHKAREVIRGEKYHEFFPEVELTKSQDAKSLYRNTRGGDRFACTVAGKSPTGFHAHFLIIDDALDPKKAASETELKIAQSFMTEVLPSRKVDKEVSVIFLIMQRLHETDPTGVMLAVAKREGASTVRHVCLPAELAEGVNISPPELREKYIDGLMDPRRLSRSSLMEARSNGEYSYAGQYLQSPITIGGGMFRVGMFNQRAKAAPYKAKRIWYVDRACLVPGTVITVLGGDKPIEKVLIGDSVLTREGFRKVKWSGPTKSVDSIVSVKLSNGSIISGTEDHLVWTDNRGWCELGSLSREDSLICLDDRSNTCKGIREKGKESQNQEPRLFGSREDLIIGDQELGTIGEEGNLFTEQYGCSTMERFQRDTTFITRMRIGIITTSKIWNAFRERNTTRRTEFSLGGTKRKKEKNRRKGLLLKREQLLQKRLVYSVGKNGLVEKQGTEPKSVAEFVEIDTNLVLNRENVLYVNVSFGIGQDQGLAPTSVLLNTGQQNVISAERILRRNKWFKSIVHPTALEKVGGETIVYDLEVENAHEFFANGILVHNSTQDGGCATAMVLMARDYEGNYFVEHVVSGHWEPDRRNEEILAAAIRTRSRYGPKNEPAIWIEREGGASGRDAWKSIMRKLAGFAVYEHQPTGKKEVRAEPWACQVAAGNGWMVEDGTWDVASYVAEHTLFPKGRLKDRVDASSGAFCILANQTQAGSLRIYRIGKRFPTAKVRVVVCDKDQLANLDVEDHHVLLLSIGDPTVVNAEELPPPPNRFTKLLGFRRVSFADLEPKDYQNDWGAKVEPYGLPVSELAMNREHGKKIWSFLLKKYQPAPEVFVFQGEEGDKRSLSLAYAFCDSMQLRRDMILYKVGDVDNKHKDAIPPNEHVYSMVKATRDSVVA